MQSRRLGAQGLEVGAIGQGCMGLSVFYGTDTAAARPHDVINHALDRGITLIDTSDAYGPHTNEIIVGEAIRHRRDEVILSTKFGVVRTSEEGAGSASESAGLCGRPDYVMQACDASLQRLGTDYIDLYIQHRLDPDTPVEDTVGAMGELVQAGKVRHIALCEVGPETIRRAHSTFPLSAVDAEYSLWHRDPELSVLDTVHDLGLGFLPYCPLGRGFLTGTIRSLDDLGPDDWRRHSPRFQGENFTHNLTLVDRLHTIARDKGCTPAQLALAWLLTRDFVVPVQGATTAAQIDENVQAANIELTTDDLDTIAAAAPSGWATGASWPDGSVGASINTT